MRPVVFSPLALRRVFLRSKIATLADLKNALGTDVAITIFRKLKPMDYLTSYSHAGRYYTLREITDFDRDGLWSHKSVWFSSRGTLLATAADFVRRSPNGYFADELAKRLHVEVHDALLQLVEQRQIARQLISGIYLYTSDDAALSRQQLLARRELPTLLSVTAVSHQISADELNAAIVLFYSMLDEKQRRLYAGLESLKLGHGGDRQLADLLGLDTHTVARGRHELLTKQIDIDGVRHRGGGRHAVEKKHQK